MNGELARKSTVRATSSGVPARCRGMRRTSLSRSSWDNASGKRTDPGATATLMVLDAARKAKVRRVVFASTSAAYGNSPAPAKKETDLPEPISPYGATKVAGELYCNAFAASRMTRPGRTNFESREDCLDVFM